MNKPIKCLAAVGLLLWPALAAHASGDVGYNQIAVPPNSDLVMAVPFRSAAVFNGTVSAVSPTTVTVAGTPFIVNEFQNLFYIRYTSGAKNGLWSTITANTVNVLTVADATTGVAIGDTFQIEAHWTLGTLFPAWLEGTAFFNSTGTLGTPSVRRTEVRLIDELSAGINRAAGVGGTFFFGTSAATGFWRSTGATAVNANNTVLKPQQYLVVRNINTNLALKVFTLGEVDKDKVGTRVRRETVANDNPLSSGRPVPVSLAELGLAGTPAFTSSPNASPVNRQDEIRLFDNAASGINKAAGTGGTFFHRSDLNIWVSTSATSTDISTNKIIQPSQGLVIRRRAATASVTDWSNNAPY